MTVRYRSATLGEFIEHHSYDVSRGGMFIKTPSPFPAGTLLKFEVKIADEQRVMQGVGRVVWKREESEQQEGAPAGMGIKFIKIDDASQSVIEKLVESRKDGRKSAFDTEPSRDSGRMFPDRPRASLAPQVGGAADASGVVRTTKGGGESTSESRSEEGPSEGASAKARTGAASAPGVNAQGGASERPGGVSRGLVMLVLIALVVLGIYLFSGNRRSSSATDELEDLTQPEAGELAPSDVVPEEAELAPSEVDNAASSATPAGQNDEDDEIPPSLAADPGAADGTPDQGEDSQEDAGSAVDASPQPPSPTVKAPRPATAPRPGAAAQPVATNRPTAPSPKNADAAQGSPATAPSSPPTAAASPAGEAEPAQATAAPRGTAPPPPPVERPAPPPDVSPDGPAAPSSP